MKVRLVASMSTLIGIALAVFAAFSLWPAPAEATMYTANLTMDEAQALNTCNPNPSPAGGGGSGTVTYDDVTNMLSWTINFSNLSGAALAAHFHGPALPGVSAGIQVTIGDLTSPSVGSMVITEPQEADLLAGLWYINYHTAICGSGEIRGQVVFPPVGGVTELTNPAAAPLATTPGSNDNNGVFAGVAAAIAALTLVGAGSVLLVGRRLIRRRVQE